MQGCRVQSQDMQLCDWALKIASVPPLEQFVSLNWCYAAITTFVNILVV